MRGGAPLAHDSLVAKSKTMLFFILNAFIPSMKIDFATSIQSGDQARSFQIYTDLRLNVPTASEWCIPNPIIRPRFFQQQKRHCWETLLSCSVEPLESRDACGSEFIPIEPGHHTHHINRSGNPKMLQVRFGKADITGAAHAKGTHPLRNRRFDPLSQRILPGNTLPPLPTTGGLERFMLGLRSGRDGPPLVLFCRADTVDPARTATAIFFGELYLDHPLVSVVGGTSLTHPPVS